MRLNSIRITNFRGFENRGFTFDPAMNVVIGCTGSGKTSLLKAIKIALGAYLKSLRCLPKDKSFRLNFSASDVYRHYEEKERGLVANKERTRIEVDGDLFVTKKRR